jgi:CheY-like chemotaxis protein
LSSKLAKPIEAALQGANSASQLTHRLLAFSRRQPLTPARINMNRLVSGMIDMLRRTLGAEISIETIFAAGLWPAFADANQLENVLLNLALNAKAAMPNGGCLTIETANTYLDDAYVRHFGDVDAGQYVVLCVTDTGTGIPKDILHRVFEPFFTTKTSGEGSGLGLAMVHGFVKQSGGHVRIYSEEGHGTTVKIYLPRLTGAEEVAAVPAGKPSDVSVMPRARPNEVILVVEDSDGVRVYAKEILEDLGYWVHEAADADQAMRAVAKKPRIDLLFTDVVLPGSASGRELADQIKQLYPHLPVLFTTGYTRNAIVHQGRLDPGVHLLNKPYTQQDLARKIRELLDA